MLPGGTYYFHEMHLVDSSVLTFTGPTTIYVTGHSDIHGQIKTYQNLPKNLQIRVLGHETFKLNSDSSYYASIYAPKAKVEMDHKGDLYGAVLAKSLKIGNQCLVHYDESLRGSGGSMVATVK